jgi:hypothetical protein
MCDNFYKIILTNILNEKINYNLNILLFINNYYNIYEEFSHLIKKYNLTVYLVIDNNIDYVSLTNNISGEEYENNIKIVLNEESITNIIFDIIIIFHLFSLNNLKDKLTNINNISNNNTNLYIYSSLSNENDSKINYKNYLRESIKKYTKFKIGNLLSFSNVLDTIKTNNFTVNSINIFKKNNYILYGDNIVYQIIISKNI